MVYTDGGSRGNPGPAGVGFAIYGRDGRLIKGEGKAIGTATNNEAEYRAVVAALEKARALFGKSVLKDTEIEVRLDSELVARQLSGIYKIEEERLFPLFMKIWNLRLDIGNITFRHIPRSENHVADRYVNEALDREQGILFRGEGNT